MPRLARAGAALALAVWLGACSTGAPLAPVSDRARALRQPEAEYRTVVRGDTLYSIAWESGRDYRELAAWNHIAPPYTIRPGQKIRLYPLSAGGERPAEKTPAPKTETDRTARTAKETQQAPSPSKAGSAERKSAAREFGPWTWPTEGKLLNHYSESGTSKGLDIAAARGQPVWAAADGRVVYQGSGLRGYGQLIIIKHNDEFLSAYAHNDRIYVKEGESVKRGQKIAAAGSTGTDRVKLHFEIRRNGVPVNPLQHLPKK
jgi:lipoprotein NlpD